MNHTTDPAAAAENRKRQGMALAARPRRTEIATAQIALLNAILSNPAREGTTDDLGDLTSEREAGGRWVGTVPQQLAKHGLISRVGFRQSARATRNCTPVGVWRAVVSDQALILYRDTLLSMLAALPSVATAAPRPTTPSRQTTLFGPEPDRLPD